MDVGEMEHRQNEEWAKWGIGEMGIGEMGTSCRRNGEQAKGE